MLGLFGKKSDHPLADMKSAQQTLADVPKSEAVTALQEITGWLESLQDGAEDFKLDHYWAVLRLFDEAAQPFVRKLLRDYFTVQPLTPVQENRLWLALNRYYQQSAQTHHDLFSRYRRNVRGAAALKSQLPLLGVRALAALSGCLKLAAVRYALVDTHLWQHLAGIYSQAEQGGYQDEGVAATGGGGSSISREFAVLLSWYGVSAGSLGPLQIHLAERLVAHYARQCRVSREPLPDARFVFDLEQPAAPMRLSSEITLHPGLRYLVVGDSVTQLEAAITLLDRGVLPQELNLHGASYPAELLAEAARRLVQVFRLPPQARRNPRRRIAVNLQVASGFFQLLEQTELGLNFSPAATETWDVEDISATGFRSVLGSPRREALKIGMLVGSRPDRVPHWGAGVIRRLSRDAQNRLHVGVEMLASQIIGVTVKEQGTEVEHAALYLHRPGDQSGEAWLLLRPDAFSPNRSLNLTLDGRQYLLLPLGLAEKGVDYDLARYRKMEQDSAEAEAGAY